MAKHNYDEAKVLNLLARKGAVISYSDKTITVAKNSTSIGINTLGKLDFLEHYCGWRIIRITFDEIQLQRSNKYNNENKKKKQKKHNDLDLSLVEDINDFTSNIKLKKNKK